MSDRTETRGMLLVFISYVVWGLFPLYWCLLASVPVAEIALHRMVWCALFAGGIVLWRHRVPQVRASLSDRRLVLTLTVSGLLVAADWTIYIWSVSSHQLVEAALGLFVTPLVTILLGLLMLGERVSVLRALALALGVAALLMKLVAYGHVPWIAFGIAIAFGLYGYVRKKAPVDPLDGLFIETGLIAPAALLAIVVLACGGTGAFRLSAPVTSLLLVCGGAVTAAPLALFVCGVRRIRLSSVGFVQYFSPGLTLALAVFGFRERLDPADIAAFSCLWIALVLIGIEGPLAARKCSGAKAVPASRSSDR